MFEPKVKISRALYDRLKKRADDKGYSSVDEFVTHLLEGAVADAATGASEEQIRERLRGLGYLK